MFHAACLTVTLSSSSQPCWPLLRPSSRYWESVCLYYLIQDIQPSLVGKVTSMLLELDYTEVLHLLESPEALRARADEAVAV